jgi:hypothetical protein
MDAMEVLPAWAASLALAYVEAGRPEEARPLLEAQLARGFDLPRDRTWLMGHANFADCAVALANDAACRILTERLAPHVSKQASPGVHTFGCVARPQGLRLAVLGDLDSAEEMLRRAVAAHEEFRTPYWTARSQLDLAAVLRRRGGATSEADALTDTALQTADRHGFAGLPSYTPLPS